MNISVDSLRSNSILMENISEMMMAQEGLTKLHYDDVAFEAMATPEGQAVLLDKLFKETQKLDSIDFGRIPDTRGDITKYQYYNQLNDCIELINEIIADAPTTNVTTMNRLHHILLDGRQDFEYGFKSDNYLIINMYKVMVLTLFELENVCIVDMTNHIRTRLKVSLNSRTVGEVRSITKTASQFIKMYENGQWNTMMKTFRSGKALEFAASHEEGHTPATEDAATLQNLVNAATKAIQTAKDLPGTVSGVKADAKDLFRSIFEKKSIRVMGIIAIVIASLFIIRKAIYLFINGAANLKKILKTNAEILKTNISTGDNTGDGVEKQKKMLEHLENTADVIEYNVLKSEHNAAVEIAKNDRENFSSNELRNLNGADFEF